MEIVRSSDCYRPCDVLGRDGVAQLAACWGERCCVGFTQKENYLPIFMVRTSFVLVKGIKIVNYSVPLHFKVF